jgi:nickel/cobalt exporter
MSSLIVGSLLLSLLHALIPSHWLPILAIGRKENWDSAKVTRVTMLAGLAHAASTVAIGMALALVGSGLSARLQGFTEYLAPALLVGLGIFYIYQHSRHHHFHLHGHPEQEGKVIFSLAVAMFLSPCFEIEPYFLAAGAHGLLFAGSLALMYAVVTVTGMVLWVRMSYISLLKLNWHGIEHNAGIITGLVLVITGILSFFIQ